VKVESFALVDVMLFIVGFAAGFVTSVVGGGSLFAYPAMEAAGLSPTVASASYIVALMPASILAAFADPPHRPRWTKEIAKIIAISIVGGVVGAALLVVTPERIFMFLVPGLIALGTVAFAFSEPIKRWAARQLGPGGRSAHAGDRLVPLLFVSLYGGYFASGVTIMLLAILALGAPRDIHTNNVLKNLLAGLCGIGAILYWISGCWVGQCAVAGHPTFIMMGGAAVGGICGGRTAGKMPAALLRWCVITIGAMLTLFYCWKYWRN
jgi:uncharacterized membrane protein YfcA